MSRGDEILSHINTVIVNPIIYLLFGLALVTFLWGVVQFILGADNEEARSTGKQQMMWGIVGLFIMVSAYGIIYVILHTFQIDTKPIDDIRAPF